MNRLHSLFRISFFANYTRISYSSHLPRFPFTSPRDTITCRVGITFEILSLLLVNFVFVLENFPVGRDFGACVGVVEVVRQRLHLRPESVVAEFVEDAVVVGGETVGETVGKTGATGEIAATAENVVGGFLGVDDVEPVGWLQILRVKVCRMPEIDGRKTAGIAKVMIGKKNEVLF